MIGFLLSTGETVSARANQRVEFELNNAALEDDLIPGSYSLEITIDDVDGNFRKLQLANRHDILQRTTVFDDVQLMLFGLKQYRGKLVIRRIRETSVDAFMVINGFSVEILETLLTEINYGTPVNLGSTPAAISTAAAAYVTQDYPAVNFNFPMLYAPQLYNGEALGWQSLDTVDAWDEDATYKLRDVIGWSDGYVYVCVDATSAGESPATHSSKWQVLISNCIVNNWIDSLSEFHINDRTYLYTQNAHNLAPQLYDKFILRQIESTIGYSIVGDFMDNANTDQSLLLNTEVLDAVPAQVIVQAQQDCVYDANTNPYITAGIYPLGYNGNGHYLHFNNEITDPDNDWTVVNPITGAGVVPSFYTIHSEGVHRITINLDVINIGAPPIDLITLVNGISVDLYQYNAAGNVVHSFEWFAPAGNIGDAISFRMWDSTGFGGFDIGAGSFIQIENLSANQYNAYSGTVTHANHVPDVTVREYLLSLKKRFNLTAHLNFFDKVIELNYCKSILPKPAKDFTDALQSMEADVQEAKGVTITETSKTNVPLSDGTEYTISATYATYQDMVDAMDAHEINDVVLLANQFAFWRLEADDSANMVWQFVASYLPPLVYGNGARQISMLDQPAQMKYLYNDGDMVLLPWINLVGNTALFGGIDNDKPLVHAMWHGLQDAENATYQYPYASPAVYDATGATIGALDLRMVEGLSASIWEMLYKEWIRKVDYSLSFEAPTVLNYKQIFELDLNSPIRKRFIQYVIKRVIWETDQSGAIKVEMQGVKIMP